MKKLVDVVEWPLAILAVLSLGLTVQARHAKADVEAPAIIVDSGEEAAPAEIRIDQPDSPSAQPYWIGILGGGVSPELRSHLGLEGAGILVREVVPGSPAAKGGLQQYDVLLTANGKPATDMAALATEVIAVGGKDDGKIVIELLRTGAHQQLVIVPAQRPAEARAPVEQPQGEWFPGGMGAFRGQPLQLRMFGPGAALGGANIDIRAPNNTSVQVHSENGATSVKVTQDGKTWEVDGADPESLNKLPPDVRPMVEGLLKSGGVDVNVDVQRMLPDLSGWLEGFGGRRVERHNRHLLRRLEVMQHQIEALNERLGVAPVAEAAPDAAEPADRLAPAFEPPAPPVEVEIPVEEE